MVVLDSVVVITALPRMQRDLHVGLASLQWTLTAYNIAFAAGIITAAAAGDRFGRRRIFNIGLALFTVASAVCALAPNASELIAARTVQGLGGAIVLPLSLTILTTAFPAERRGMIVGIYGGLAGLAVAMGPIVGGAVTQGIDWHWIFWINVPIGAVALPLAMRLLPDSYGAQERLDPLGVTLVTGGVVAIVWALVRANQSGWASAEIVSCLVSGAVLLLAFAAWEQRVSEPMVPLRLFRSRAFAVGNATTFLMTGAIFAAGFLVTQEFQLARGYSPVSAGVRLLPFFATPMFISPIAGAVSDRIGRRPVMATGLFLQTAGFAWVAVAGSLSTSWVELDIALPDRRRRRLDGAADRAHRRAERRRPARAGQGIRNQLHDAALRRRLRDRRRQRRVRRLRTPRHARKRHRRLQACARRLCRLRATGRAQRACHHTAEDTVRPRPCRGRVARPARTGHRRRRGLTKPKDIMAHHGFTTTSAAARPAATPAALTATLGLSAGPAPWKDADHLGVTLPALGRRCSRVSRAASCPRSAGVRGARKRRCCSSRIRTAATLAARPESVG